jgi:hypothetical protein
LGSHAFNDLTEVEHKPHLPTKSLQQMVKKAARMCAVGNKHD